MSSPQSKARVISLMRPLKDVTVTAGETATFECELSYEGIAVEWFLGGTKLEPSDRVSPDFSTFDPPVEAAVFRTLRLGLKATGGLSLHDRLPASACYLIRSCWWKVQDSSRGFDPSFEITQAGRLSALQAFLWGYFYQLQEVWGAWQVATADI